jgi:hypothetical protein
MPGVLLQELLDHVLGEVRFRVVVANRRGQNGEERLIVDNLVDGLGITREEVGDAVICRL